MWYAQTSFHSKKIIGLATSTIYSTACCCVQTAQASRIHLVSGSFTCIYAFISVLSDLIFFPSKAVFIQVIKLVK